MTEQPSAGQVTAANRSVEGCACQATSARLLWVGGRFYGWWVTLHILDNAIVHASAAYDGGGHWVAGKGMITSYRHGLAIADD